MRLHDEISSRQFGSAVRGWDKDEVSAFLAEVADDYRAAMNEAALARSDRAELSLRTERLEELLRSADGLCQDAREATKAAEAQRDAALGQVAALERALTEARTEAEAATRAVQVAPPTSTEGYAQVGEEVTAVLRTAGEAAGSMRAEAERWAADTRGKADQYAAAVRRKADDHSEAVRRQAGEALAAAQQRSAELCASADRYCAETKDGAQAAANAGRAQADERIRGEIEAAQTEAAALLANANDELERLRTTEQQLRQGLSAAAAWIQRSLASPFDELSPADRPVAPESAAPEADPQRA